MSVKNFDRKRRLVDILDETNLAIDALARAARVAEEEGHVVLKTYLQQARLTTQEAFDGALAELAGIYNEEQQDREGP